MPTDPKHSVQVRVEDNVVCLRRGDATIDAIIAEWFFDATYINGTFFVTTTDGQVIQLREDGRHLPLNEAEYGVEDRIYKPTFLPPDDVLLFGEFVRLFSLATGSSRPVKFGGNRAFFVEADEGLYVFRLDEWVTSCVACSAVELQTGHDDDDFENEEVELEGVGFLFDVIAWHGDIYLLSAERPARMVSVQLRRLVVDDDKTTTIELRGVGKASVPEVGLPNAGDWPRFFVDGDSLTCRIRGIETWRSAPDHGTQPA